MLCFGFKPINLSLNLLNQMSIVVIIINGASDKYPDTQYSCKLIYYAMQNDVFVLIKLAWPRSLRSLRPCVEFEL